MGVLGGLFVLGAVTRRANAMGALTGAVVRAGVMFCLWKFTAINGYLYTASGITSCVVVGLAASLVTGRRDTTNVPVQALYLLNSVFVLERSAAFARRVEQHSGDLSSQIQYAYQLCFARNPDAGEVEAAQHFLKKHPDFGEGLAALCQALFSTAEFRNLD